MGQTVDDKHGVILSTQATGDDIADNNRTIPLLDKVLSKLNIVPEKLATDRIKDDVEVYKELINRDIIPCINRKRAVRRKVTTYGKELFTYLSEDNFYLCLEGHKLWFIRKMDS